MACPACGCKVHYQYNADGFGADDERMERCAACGHIFDIEDSADEPDDQEPASDAPLIARSQRRAVGLERLDPHRRAEDRRNSGSEA